MSIKENTPPHNLKGSKVYMNLSHEKIICSIGQRLFDLRKHVDTDELG